MPNPIIRAANAREKARQEKNQWKARARKAERLLAAVHELHILYTDIRELQWCYHCETPWPCPTRRTLDGD